MKTVSKAGLIVAVGVLISCAPAQRVRVSTKPEIHPQLNIAYLIAPFEDANAQKYKEKFPEAAKVVAGAFETAFLGSGYRIVSKGKEDAIVTGTVRAYYRGRFMRRDNTTVDFEVKATHSKTGQVLWKGAHKYTTLWDYDHDPRLVADKVAREIVQSLNSVSRRQSK